MTRIKHIVPALMLLLCGGIALADFNPTDPPEPGVPTGYLKVVLGSQPASWGSASASKAAPDPGDNVTITGRPNSGYKFVCWTDSKGDTVSTETKYSFTMPAKNVRYTAHFAYSPADPSEPGVMVPGKKLYLLSDPASGASLYGAGEHVPGDKFTVSCSPNSFYKFVEWVDANDSVISTTSSFTYTMPGQHTTLTARLKVDPNSPSEPGSSADKNRVEPPVIKVSGRQVSITSLTSGAKIYYTLDGTVPDSSSTLYSGPFTVRQSCTVTAVAMYESMTDSPVRALYVDMGGADVRPLMFSSNYRERQATISHPNEYETEFGFKALTEADHGTDTGVQTMPLPYTFEVSPEYMGYYFERRDDFGEIIESGVWMPSFHEAPVLEYDGRYLKAYISGREEGDELYVDGLGYAHVPLPDFALGVDHLYDNIRAHVESDGKFRSDEATLRVDYYVSFKSVTQGYYTVKGVDMAYRSPASIGDVTKVCLANAAEVLSSRFVRVDEGELKRSDIETALGIVVPVERVQIGCNVKVAESEDLSGVLSSWPVKYLHAAGNTLKRGIAKGLPELTNIIWCDTVRMEPSFMAYLDNPNTIVWTLVDNAPEQTTVNVAVLPVSDLDMLDAVDFGDSTGSIGVLALLPGYPFETLANLHAGEAMLRKEFNVTTRPGVSRGWESLFVPFDVERIIVYRNGEEVEIAPIESQRAQADENMPVFWLYGSWSTEGWQPSSSISAGWPNIISMPNYEGYAPQYNISGPVTFWGHDVEITTSHAGGLMCTRWGENVHFYGTTATPRKPSGNMRYLGLNAGRTDLGDGTVTWEPGSMFTDQVEPKPFDCWLGVNDPQVTRIPVWQGSAGVDLPNIDDDLAVTCPAPGTLRVTSMRARTVDIYTVTGVRVASLGVEAGQSAQAEGLAPGVYIAARRKIAVR